MHGSMNITNYLMFLLPSRLAQFYVFNASPVQSPQFVKMGQVVHPCLI
jgi:hypothetical protein